MWDKGLSHGATGQRPGVMRIPKPLKLHPQRNPLINYVDFMQINENLHFNARALREIQCIFSMSKYIVMLVK